MQNFSDHSDETDDSADGAAIGNAETVIERFGGIRPMAAKMDVPVTTVQGWKKRNVIPGNRRDDVMNAARTHNIDLSDVVANQNNAGQGDFAATLAETSRSPSTNSGMNRIYHAEPGLTQNVTHDDLMRQLRGWQTTTLRKSVIASAALLTLVAIAGGLLFAVGNQKLEQDSARIAVLEQQAPEGVKSGGFMALVNEIKSRLTAAESSISQLKDQAKALTGTNPDLTAVVGRLEQSQQLQGAVTDLKALVEKMQGRMDGMDDALAQEQQSSSALGQALEGVSPKELKAAAMLIGLNQFRSSVNRGTPFADDLAMLQGMVGDKDPELTEAINNLAPYAEKGVLSPEGLSDQLKGLTGDIVVASVQGEHVSVQDKAMARLQNIVSIKKDGQPVMGNASQTTVAEAQKMLDAGDVNGAIAKLQTLQGPARDKAQPIIDQGQITMMAQKVQSLLGGSIAAQIKNAVHPVTLTAKPGIPGLGAGVMGPPKMAPAQNFNAPPESP